MNPEPVNGLIMLIVSTAGLFVNVIMAMILYHSGDAHLHSHAGDDGHHDHNEKDGDLVLRAVRVFLFSLSLSLSLTFSLSLSHFHSNLTTTTTTGIDTCHRRSCTKYRSYDCSCANLYQSEIHDR